MDTDVAALILALGAFVASMAALALALVMKQGPGGQRGPEGPPGPRGAPGTTPSLDAICDRVVEILDPRAGVELVRELGSRWPVAAISNAELPSVDKGVMLLSLFLEANRAQYGSFLIVGQFDPDRDEPSQFGGSTRFADAEIAIGICDDCIYVVKDRHGVNRVIDSPEQIS